MNAHDDLPSLPDPVDFIHSPDGNGAAVGAYTANQMREYAIAALAAPQADQQGVE